MVIKLVVIEAAALMMGGVFGAMFPSESRKTRLIAGGLYFLLCQTLALAAIL